MFHWLFRNIGNIALSIILGVVVWVIAVNEANPSRENTFRNLPIIFVNTPPNSEVYDASAASVDVTLSAPQATWDDLTPRVISATIDLGAAGGGEGVYRVSLGVPESMKRLVRVVRVEPASISVKVEPRSSQPIPVQINLVGEPPVGYKVAHAATLPATVTVSGPASLVDRVTGAASEFSVQGASETLSQTIALKPVDAGGRDVPNVTIAPDRVSLRVDIERLAGFGSLAVKVVLTGTQASGYRLAEVNVAPSYVTVIGSPTTLAAMPGFVETEPIDISGAQSDIEKDIRLNLPQDVALYEQQSVRVTVKIEPVVTSLTISSTLTFAGLSPALAARASPESVEVILVGPLPLLESLDVANDVRVILDLTDLGIGTYQIEPRVETLPGITAQSILPSVVQVTIERAPRGTPTTTPAATPTKKP